MNPYLQKPVKLLTHYSVVFPFREGYSNYWNFKVRVNRIYSFWLYHVKHFNVITTFMKVKINNAGTSSMKRIAFICSSKTNNVLCTNISSCFYALAIQMQSNWFISLIFSLLGVAIKCKWKKKKLIKLSSLSPTLYVYHDIYVRAKAMNQIIAPN